MTLLTFKDWMIQQESSPSTRLRRDAALGLKPIAGMGSINGHSTALPWEKDSIVKQDKDRTNLDLQLER